MNDQEFLFLQGLTLALAVTGFTLMGVFQIKREHLEGPKWLAVLGGALIGLFISLVIVIAVLPFRVEGRSDSAPPWLPAVFLVFLVIRSDRLTKLPLLGAPLRAYRIASLRRSIQQSHQRLDKLGAAGDTTGSQPQE